MLQSSSFMYWDIKYVNLRIYFMKNVGDFEVLKLVFISDLNTVFLTRNVLSDFGSYRSPNPAYDSFLKIPRCLVFFPKILAYGSLWFGSYRSWREGCSEGVRL